MTGPRHGGLDERSRRQTLHPLPQGHAAAAGGAAERLRAATPESALRDDASRIERTCRFGNFCNAFALLAAAAVLAEAERHHPDISFGWGEVTTSLTGRPT